MSEPHEEAETGRIAGFGAGMLAGAQIGTAMLPIPLVGTITGALVGGALGSQVGQRIAPTIIGIVNAVIASQQAGPEIVQSIPRNAIVVVEESPDASDHQDALEQLAALHGKGVLTDAEFDTAKRRLLQP